MKNNQESATNVKLGKKRYFNFPLVTLDLFYFILLLLVPINTVILFDIPVIRPVLTFLFLTFVPGFLILRLLRLDKLESTEIYILSIGLSIMFVMLFGISVDFIQYSLGFFRPYSTLSLLLSFNLACIIMFFLGPKYQTKISLPSLNFSRIEKNILLIAVILPFLTIIGMNLMNSSGNNIILMLLLILISILVLLISTNNNLSKRLYPCIIMLISLSIILLLALRSNHIIGVDAHTEYYIFQQTLYNLHWSILQKSTLDTCLSISVLPAIYASFLNVPLELFFKIFYSLIYSISPLIVYTISKKYFNDLFAFLASCFFMFQSIFFFTAFNPRTNVAQLFFALSIMILFNTRIPKIQKRLLFILFIISCIVSHYATTYIFLITLFLSFVLSLLLSRKYNFTESINFTTILLFFTLVFFWYSQLTGAAFTSGVGFIKQTLINLNLLFSQESQSNAVPIIIGKGILQRGIPYLIEFSLTWITIILVGIGVISVIKNPRRMVLGTILEKPVFLKEKIDILYFVITIVCCLLLLSIIILPFVSRGYGLDRLYAFTTTIIPVFFILGCLVISRSFHLNPILLILLILIPYLLSTSGFTYIIFNHPNSIILSSKGEEYDRYYVHNQEASAATWFKSFRVNETIYSDAYGNSRIISQGHIISARYSASFVEHDTPQVGYLYLRYTGVVDKKFLDGKGVWHNKTTPIGINIKEILIYSNGGSDVYKIS
jgi:uncharacterized membrane protein